MYESTKQRWNCLTNLINLNLTLASTLTLLIDCDFTNHKPTNPNSIRG